MGLYVKEQDIRDRLIGKVRFTDNPEGAGQENRMPVALLSRLVREAEGQVELDLSPRYGAPFKTDADEPFHKLPDTTQNNLRTLCELMSVIRVLETDFGSGSASDGSKYKKSQQDRYDALIAQLTKIKGNSYRTWVYPPLPGLKLNYHNEVGDDGFAGRVLTSNTECRPYPTEQINHPEENYINGRIKGGS